MTAVDVTDTDILLPNGGETGALIRRFDWSKTALGAIRTWPQTLRSTVALALSTPYPIVMLWGPDGILIYNDAYAAFAGCRHPGLLGAKSPRRLAGGRRSEPPRAGHGAGWRHARCANSA